MSNIALGSSHLNLTAFDRRGLQLSTNIGMEKRHVYKKEEETLAWVDFIMENISYPRRPLNVG